MIADAFRSLLGNRYASNTIDATNPRDPALVKMFGLGAGTKAGVSVTEETALALPPIWRAVNILSNGVAFKANMHVYRLAEDGNRTIDRGHFARTLIRKNGKPNSFQTSGKFQKTLQQWALLWGNGCAAVERLGSGQAYELIPLMPDRTGMKEIDGREFYYSWFGSERRLFLPENVFHIPGLCSNGRWGISVVQFLREHLGGQQAVSEHSHRYFGQGANSNGFFEMPPELDDEEAQENWQKSLSGAMEGLSKAHRAIALSSGTKWHQLSMSNEDSQFIETAKFKVKEAALIMGIQAAKLGDRAEQSYNSLEMANQEHKEDDLCPWLCTWAEEATDKLLTEEEKETESHEIDFDDKTLAWVPQKERHESADKSFETGLIDRDEGRIMIGLPPAKPDQQFKQRSNVMNEGDAVQDSVIREEPETETEENGIAAKLASHELNRIVYNLSRKATVKAKDSKAFGEWLDGLTTKHGAAILHEQSEPMVKELKERLDAVYSTSTNETFAADITAAIESLKDLPEKYQLELV